MQYLSITFSKESLYIKYSDKNSSIFSNYCCISTFSAKISKIFFLAIFHYFPFKYLSPLVSVPSQPTEWPAPILAPLSIVNHPLIINQTHQITIVKNILFRVKPEFAFCDPFTSNQMMICIRPASSPGKMHGAPARKRRPAHPSGKQRINLRLITVPFLFFLWLAPCQSL